jgi:hypothetical protein
VFFPEPYCSNEKGRWFALQLLVVLSFEFLSIIVVLEIQP